MGLSYHDLSVLRFIQNRNRVPLAKVAIQFNRNETSIRRNIDKINFHADRPLVQIDLGWCVSLLSYDELVDFIRHISPKDYDSSSEERILVMVTAIFFNSYVNASALYDQWGLSLTTKKQDTAALRSYLEAHGLKLITLKKKGLGIAGDKLRLRFLVINILHPLLEYTADNRINARRANTPLEKQTFDLAEPHIQTAAAEAVRQLNDFLASKNLSLNYPSKKFLLLFICLMTSHPLSRRLSYTSQPPLPPLPMNFACCEEEALPASIALSLLSYSNPPDFPYDRQLWHITETFLQKIIENLPHPFFIQEDMIQEFYRYFYREILLHHYQCGFVDKTVENTQEQFPELYESIERYSVLFKAIYNFPFQDEQLSTLTLLIEKHILRNQTIDQHKKRIVIITSINFERISFFLEQIREQINLQWVITLNINEIHQLEALDYDYIFCFSTRIYNLLSASRLPVIRLNFFLTPADMDHLLALGFTPLKHRFQTTSFVLDLAGKSEREMVRWLREHYPDYFV